MHKTADIVFLTGPKIHRSGSIFLLALLMQLTLCNLYVTANGNETNYKPRHDTILIASEPDYPPFCMVDEEGNAIGFSIDLFKAATQAVGLVPDIEIGVWDHIRHDLARGRIDALPLVGRTPEREALYEFTMPYLSLHGAVFVRKNMKDIATLSDLKDKEILVMKGDNAEEYVRRKAISNKIFTTNTYEEAFELLAGGHHDVVITQRIVGIHLIDQLKYRSVKQLDIQLPGFRQDFCFATRKGDTELISRLNEGLSVVIANDTYEQIRNHWFGPHIEQEIKIKEMIRVILFFLILSC